MIIRYLTLLIMALLFKVCDAQDPDFHIYLCFGQSNMEGQGTIEKQDQTGDSSFQVLQSVTCMKYTKDVWRIAKPPLARCNTGLGPVDYFGRTMIENLPSNIKVGILKVAVAGCKIELFDKNNYITYIDSLSSEQEWMVSIIDEYGGNPYGRLVELAQIAQQDGIIKGILMHQGESNVNETDWPDKVKLVYNNLISDLGLNAEEVPLLAGEVVHAEQGGVCASHNTIINTLPESISNAHVISSKGCEAQDDNLHFSSAGYRELGARYAKQMLTLIQPSGISDCIDSSVFEVSPNPFVNSLSISYDGLFGYKLYNLVGSVIEEGEGNTKKVVGEKLQQGVYILQLTENSGVTRVLSIIKQ